MAFGSHRPGKGDSSRESVLDSGGGFLGFFIHVDIDIGLRNCFFTFGDGHQSIGKPRVNPNCQMSHHDIGQLASPIKARHLGAFHLKISQPVDAFAMTLDGIRQFLLVPQSAGQHFSAHRRNDLFDGVRRARRILGVGIGVENKHAFVNSLSQVQFSVDRVERDGVLVV